MRDRETIRNRVVFDSSFCAKLFVFSIYVVITITRYLLSKNVLSKTVLCKTSWFSWFDSCYFFPPGFPGFFFPEKRNATRQCSWLFPSVKFPDFGIYPCFSCSFLSKIGKSGRKLFDDIGPVLSNTWYQITFCVNSPHFLGYFSWLSWLFFLRTRTSVPDFSPAVQFPDKDVFVGFSSFPGFFFKKNRKIRKKSNLRQ